MTKSTLFCNLKVPFLKQAIRRYALSECENFKCDDKFPLSMSAWQICGYNGLQSLKLTNSLEIPTLSQPNEVLVQVKASSVNVLDVMMTEGYGQKLFEKFHDFNLTPIKAFGRSHLPYTPGRDFAGVIQAVGEGVKGFKHGDEVMGVIPPPLVGSHAQYVVVTSCNITNKPKTLSMEEAASIPYAGLTAWSALGITAELCISSKGKRALVLGASGGVGTAAVQLLKNWGCMVVATGSSAEDLSQLLILGSDFVVDHKSSEAEAELQQFGGFDVILDCTGRTKGFAYDLLKPWVNAKYVTLSPPTLKNFDEHGLLGGMIKNGMDLLAANSSAILEGKTLRWAYFVPSLNALTKLRNLAQEKKLQPVIDSVYSYDRIPEAYAKMKGHKLGKVIVQH